jgi:microcystin-dependent protein
VPDPFIGEIRTTAFSFAPAGWALCDGQELPITRENGPLFALLGTQFGGDGRSTFALPDLRRRVALHQSTSFFVGQAGGSNEVTLTGAQLPEHTHSIPASNEPATTDSPSGAVVAQGGSYANPGDQPTTAASTGAVGSGAPISIEPPYLTLNFIIALEGAFPQRG